MAKKSTPMAIKSTGAKRIKACSCPKDTEGNPKVKRDFTIESEKGNPFTGKACEECFEIINYERDETLETNTGGDGNATPTPDNEENGRGEDDF